MGGHDLRYPLPYPLPGFFPTTLPEPYPKSKIPTRPSLLITLITIHVFVQGTAQKEMLDLEDDICRGNDLSFHLVDYV